MALKAIVSADIQVRADVVGVFRLRPHPLEQALLASSGAVWLTFGMETLHLTTQAAGSGVERHNSWRASAATPSMLLRTFRRGRCHCPDIL